MDALNDVTAWTSDDLHALPREEDDRHEYKSSLARMSQLGGVVEKAASAFWNSGGGVLVVGVNGEGIPDGGVNRTVGNQPLRDWVDQALHRVEPVGVYSVAILPLSSESEGSENEKVVLVIGFSESHRLPHMASDGRVYIRAGAHSVPARLFIVEALLARRRTFSPMLRATYRLKPGTSQSLQLAIVALNDAPALDVELTLEPVPVLWRKGSNPFPLQIPLIDRTVPFFMDLSTWTMAHERVGADVQLHLRFTDILGRPYEHSQPLDVAKGIEPWHVDAPPQEKIARHLDKLTKLVNRYVQDQRRSQQRP